MNTDNKYSVTVNPTYGFRQISPTPTNEEITKYYEEEFYSSSYGQVNDSDLERQQRDAEWLNSERAEWVHHLQRLTGGVDGKSLLDIGCGWGENLK